MDSDHYGGLAEAIGYDMAGSNIWRMLEMSPNLYVDDKSGYSFLIRLGCNITGPLEEELADVVSQEGLTSMKLLHLTMSISTNSELITLCEYIENLDYLLVSLLLNFEALFPLVFSFYGRKFFKANYNWMLRNVETLFSDLKKEPDRMKAFAVLLQSFMQKIKSDYNTISIWRACTDPSRLLSCQRFRKKQNLQSKDIYAPSTALKSMVYDLLFLEAFNVDEHLIK